MPQNDMKIQLIAAVAFVLYILLCGIILDHVNPVDPMTQQIRSCQINALQMCKDSVIPRV